MSVIYDTSSNLYLYKVWKLGSIIKTNKPWYDLEYMKVKRKQLLEQMNSLPIYLFAKNLFINEKKECAQLIKNKKKSWNCVYSKNKN